MIHLVGVGEVPLGVLDALSARLTRELRESCHVRTALLDPEFAFDPVRKQYHSTRILQRLAEEANGWRLLGVASVDLYVPIFTFVFGEAQLTGHAALTSTHRLRQEFYGLPPDGGLMEERLLKESLHELGHTYGLRHCHNWSCAMAASTAIDRPDLKDAAFCQKCSKTVLAEPPPHSRK